MCKKFHQAQIFISASVLKIYFPVDYCAQTESFYLSHNQIKTFYKKNLKNWSKKLIKDIFKQELNVITITFFVLFFYWKLIPEEILNFWIGLFLLDLNKFYNIFYGNSLVILKLFNASFIKTWICFG